MWLTPDPASQPHCQFTALRTRYFESENKYRTSCQLECPETVIVILLPIMASPSSVPTILFGARSICLSVSLPLDVSSVSYSEGHCVEANLPDRPTGWGAFQPKLLRTREIRTGTVH